MTVLQERLIAEIHQCTCREDILQEIECPENNRGEWWDHVNETVAEIWSGLPLEAQLIAMLAALHEEAMDFPFFK
jgi:hypothetical protein